MSYISFSHDVFQNSALSAMFTYFYRTLCDNFMQEREIVQNEHNFFFFFHCFPFYIYNLVLKYLKTPKIVKSKSRITSL